MTCHKLLGVLLIVLAGMTMFTDGNEQFNSTESNFLMAMSSSDQSTVTTTSTDQSTVTTAEITSTLPQNFNITCQEGPEADNPPANQTCDCGEQNYFYGNYCQNVNLDAADDINTSKRVMEIQWAVFPNFTREYLFVYRESDSNGAPLKQQVEVKEASSYFYAWLTYLKSGEVNYIVCVIEETIATELIENEDYWSRVDDVNQDCVSIQTEVVATREMTMAAILIGGGMGIALIVIFTANFCVSRQKNIQRADDEYSDRVLQTMVLTGDMNTHHEYIEMYDRKVTQNQD